MIPPKQKAPDQSAFTTTRIAPSASFSGDGLVKHALNLRAIRASKEGQFIDRNSGKSPLFSACHHRAPGEDRSVWRFPTQEITVSHSRDLAHFPFTPASVNLRPSWATSLTRPGAFARIRSFFRAFSGALAARLFRIIPSNTARLAAPSVSNSEFAA